METDVKLELHGPLMKLTYLKNTRVQEGLGKKQKEERDWMASRLNGHEFEVNFQKVSTTNCGPAVRWGHKQPVATGDYELNE